MFKNNQDVFQILSEAISEGFIIVNEDQNIIALNSAIEKMFDYSKGELTNKPLNSLIPITYHKNHTSHFKTFIKASAKRSMGIGKTLLGAKKDGSTFPVEVGLNPFKVDDKTYIMALIVDITKRESVEENLMIKSKALQSASNGIIITDALKKDNPIIYLNAAFKKLTGYSEEEILHKNCRFLQADDRDQDSIKQLQHAFKNGESCQTEIRNYKKDGTLFWNELNITPVKNSNNIVTHFIGIQNDITERKMAEEKQNHLATIFDESLNEIYVFDAKSLKFINANYGAQKNSGYTIEELKEMTPIDIKPIYCHNQFEKSIEMLLSKKNVEKIEFETLYERKNGTIYPVNIRLQLSSLGGKPVFVAMVLDITERKKQESFKNEQNEILELIVQNHPLNIILNKIIDNLEGQSNDIFVSILALDEDLDVLKTLSAKNLPKAFNKRIDDLKIGVNIGSYGTTAFLKKEIIVTDIKNDKLWKDYKNIALNYNLNACWSTPIFSSNKIILGTIIIFSKNVNSFESLNKQNINVSNKLASIAIEKHKTDEFLKKANAQLKVYTEDLQELVEEQTKELKKSILQLKIANINLENEVDKRKKAEKKTLLALEKEKELNELKTKFLSLVSHEFKTPLSGILTSSMLVSKYKLADEQHKRDKHLDIITNKVYYLNNILNDFLSIEKLETGNVKYNYKDFKLSKVVNEVIYTANMLLKDGQNIIYPKNIDEIILNQDEKIVELTLSNVLHNAIKYSPEHSIITIDINQDDTKTTFKISDNGIGIPKKDQKNIFNRYFRAENVLNSEGTGIGLNIVKSHLENLNGTIQFTSEENKGSVFTITIPNTPTP